MLLSELLQELPVRQVRGPVDVPIARLESDSRRVMPGDLFVAIRGGQEEDRHRFVPDALERGAQAVVVEDSMDSGEATCIEVENCRRALAELAARYFGYPGRRLLLTGITGTNGKTTTALLLRQIIEAEGRKCGYLGTLGAIVDGEIMQMSNTTPEAPELHGQLRAMVDAGSSAAVLEVSSHGLALERVNGLRFRAAVFTNLTRDHLDFHQTEEHYFNTKARLFEGLDTEAGRAIVNLDDPAAPALLERIKAPVVTYGRTAGAQVRLLGMETLQEGMRLRLQSPLGEVEVETPLVGGFNAYNTTAALASGIALEIALEAILEGIAHLTCVPGRFERVAVDRDFQVIVDYAHTPDGLETVLRAARELTTGRLICVFGCGGDRDRGKRPQMGRIAGDFADVVFLTSDNPRSEDPGKIIVEIEAGMADGQERWVIPDRREAIFKALESAVSGDLVLIAGKGHEPVQVLADRSIPFDDRQVARQLSAVLDSGGGGGHASEGGVG